MKLAKKDITEAIERTPEFMDGANIRAMKSIFLGFYSPREANWSWELHAISVDNRPLVVAARFGHIVARGR